MTDPLLKPEHTPYGTIKPSAKFGGAVLHRKKFMDGRATPEEVHAALAFPPGQTCTACTRQPIGRIIVWAPLDEMMKRSEAVRLMAVAAPEKLLGQCQKFKESSSDYKGALYVRMGVAYSCKSCFTELERTAAKAPSWAVVEINRGPGEQKTITGG